MTEGMSPVGVTHPDLSLPGSSLRGEGERVGIDHSAPVVGLAAALGRGRHVSPVDGPRVVTLVVLTEEGEGVHSPLSTPKSLSFVPPSPEVIRGIRVGSTPPGVGGTC